MSEPPIGEMFKRRYWPDGPPTEPFPDASNWERLPTVTRLRAPAVAGVLLRDAWYEVGWNGTWCKAFVRPR